MEVDAGKEDVSLRRESPGSRAIYWESQPQYSEGLGLVGWALRDIRQALGVLLFRHFYFSEA